MEESCSRELHAGSTRHVCGSSIARLSALTLEMVWRKCCPSYAGDSSATFGVGMTK